MAGGLITAARQSRIFASVDLPEPVLVPVAGGEVAVFTHRSPEREGPNEDAAAVIPYGPDACVLVVADGMGGRPNGADAARIAVEALRASLDTGLAHGRPIRTAVLDGIENANRTILERAPGAGATLAVAQIRERTLRPYHVGDAFVLLTGQRGRLKLQTVAHSPVGYALESGLLNETEALAHEQRHFVSNMIGASDMHITIGSSLWLAPRDTLLVGSDGLADNFSTAELIGRIRAGKLARVAASLAEEGRARMVRPAEGHPSKPDDMTFILYRPLRSRG
ncbi:MAG: serine/threonine protein phosphatase [Acidobacteria bacterium]|nr:MAG: serine/threonine protein phosphatase [Acidobacteriota bacterium]